MRMVQPAGFLGAAGAGEWATRHASV